MPRIAPLPDAERAICRRLRDVRRSLDVSVTKFCRLIDSNPTTYSNYEQARAKVPMSVGFNVCRQFNVSQAWLAIGEGLREPAYQLDPLLVPQEAYDLPFSVGFEGYLREPIQRRQAETQRALGEVEKGTEGAEAAISALGGSEMAFPYLVDLLKASAERLPLHLHWNLFKAVVQAVRDLDKQYQPEIEQHRRAMDAGKGVASASHWKVRVEFSPPGEILEVDRFQEIEDKSAVRHTWQQLKARLKAVSSVPGNKAAMARAAKVNQSSVNSWLDDDREPGAEATFRLLEWVRVAERKLKSPGAARTAPERMARTEGSYETTKQPKPKAGSQKSRRK